MLKVGRPVERQLFSRLEDETHLAAGLQALVVLLVEVLVVDKTFQSVVETGNGEGYLLGGAVVVGHLDIAPQPRADAETNVSTLIVHRILGVDAHQSALGVLSVERALWSTENVHAVEHVEMIIESSLRHQRNVVVINAHGRIVDT